MASASFFNKEQHSSVGEILEKAETLVGGYFQVNMEDLERFPYDLRTLAHLQRQEKTRRALAQVCKYEYRKEVHPSDLRRREFYRICLQDDRILETVQSESSSLLEPLLLYVVTHELIHIIRFSLEPARFYLDPREKKAEEKHVHRMTYEVLKPFRDPYLGPLLERYRPWREGSGPTGPVLDKFGWGG